MDKFILYCRWLLALLLVGSSWAEPATPVHEIPLVMDGYAGMRVQEITTADRMRYGAALPVQHGVRVEYVDPCSPVALAGLCADDVLLSIQHYPIFKPEDVLMALARFTPGDMIKMSVLRAGKHEHLTFVMGKRRAAEVVGYLEYAPITVQNPQQAAGHQRAIAALLAMEHPDWNCLQKEFRALHGCLMPKRVFSELRFAFVRNDTIINILCREHEIVVMVEEETGRILRYVYTKNGEALPAHIKALLKTVSEGAAADIETHAGRAIRRFVEVPQEAYIGMEVTALTDEEAQCLYPLRQGRINSGLKVTRVFPESPAEKAGIQEGEILLRVNGAPLNDPFDLFWAVNDAQAGVPLHITVWRGADTGNVPVYVTERPHPVIVGELEPYTQPADISTKVNPLMDAVAYELSQAVPDYQILREKMLQIYALAGSPLYPEQIRVYYQTDTGYVSVTMKQRYFTVAVHHADAVTRYPINKQGDSLPPEVRELMKKL